MNTRSQTDRRRGREKGGGGSDCNKRHLISQDCRAQGGACMSLGSTRRTSEEGRGSRPSRPRYTTAQLLGYSGGDSRLLSKWDRHVTSPSAGRGEEEREEQRNWSDTKKGRKIEAAKGKESDERGQRIGPNPWRARGRGGSVVDLTVQRPLPCSTESSISQRKPRISVALKVEVTSRLAR